MICSERSIIFVLFDLLLDLSDPDLIGYNWQICSNLNWRVFFNPTQRHIVSFSLLRWKGDVLCQFEKKLLMRNNFSCSSTKKHLSDHSCRAWEKNPAVLGIENSALRMVSPCYQVHYSFNHHTISSRLSVHSASCTAKEAQKKKPPADRPRGTGLDQSQSAISITPSNKLVLRLHLICKTLAVFVVWSSSLIGSLMKFPEQMNR